MRKIFFSIIIFCFSLSLTAQELYPYTEPASNMPTNSVSAKFTGMFGTGGMQRYVPEIMFGVNKNLMLHLAGTFSNMGSGSVRGESIYTYGKYRFYSVDEVHKHFRMAAFAEAGYSRNERMFDEINISGDMTGVQGGLIFTQLVNRFAGSGTVSYLKSLKENSLHSDHLKMPDEAINYSLSAGYLVLPIEYKSYDQTNFNIYTELLGQRSLEYGKYFVDLAPSIQFIFKSTAKLNLGYRFQLNGNATRNADKSFMVSFEYIFLNALKK